MGSARKKKKKLDLKYIARSRKKFISGNTYLSIAICMKIFWGPTKGKYLIKVFLNVDQTRLD